MNNIVFSFFYFYLKAYDITFCCRKSIFRNIGNSNSVFYFIRSIHIFYICYGSIFLCF